jgi:hypothetical protein
MSSQTKLIKDIMSLYDTILENKKVSEAVDVYDNVDFKDYVVGKSTPSRDDINTALLRDVQTAARMAGLHVDITTAISGHDGGTRHETGNAVDVSRINGIGSGGATNGNNGNAEFRKLGNKLKDALVSMGYVWNTEIGNSKAVLWQTNKGGNHFNHVHISNKTDQPSSEPTSGDTSNKKSDSSDSSSFTTSSSYEDAKPDELVMSWANSIADFFGFNEQKNDKNLKIKSPTYSKKLEENLNRIKNLLK